MKGSGSREQVWLLRAGVVAVALVAALVSWVATRDDEDGSSQQGESQSRIVTEAELVEAANELGQPIYWAGPVGGTELELEELSEGGVRVRYVADDEEAASEALTVGSYPQADPVGALEGFGEGRGATVREASGRRVYSSDEAPSSVYFADQEGGVQVEVYAPSPEEAMNLALSGDVVPVE